LRPLLVEADNRLREIRVTNVTTRLGDGARGWPEAAPFDRIILTCAPPVIPDMLLNQLKIGGIMVAPVGRDRNQQLVTIQRSGSGFEEATLLPVKFVPLVED
jgi:protein-L-isoaspartate(D-aspartate) O-methyltransferase